MRRTVIPELLDSDAGTPNEVATSLADLRLINRCFGGVSTTRRMVWRIVRQTGIQEISLLDVGSASGDIARRVRRSMDHRGIKLHTVLMDRAPSHMEGDGPHVVGNALSLPFRDNSFDLVACALLAHDLEPHELHLYVNEALRVSRTAVLINEIRRSAIHLGLVYAGFPLFRSRLTRHDGPVSVRRAYTREELLAILQQTHASKVEIRNHYLYRMGAIVWK